MAEPRISAPPRSSPTTRLAAVAGGAALSASAAAVGWPPWLRGAGALWGAFVLVAGVAGRVTAVLVVDGAIVIRRAYTPERVVGTAEVRRVVPPRWPLGGWRIDGGPGRITLMPSDLRGAEAALASLVAGAGLRFLDGAWCRPG